MHNNPLHTPTPAQSHREQALPMGNRLRLPRLLILWMIFMPTALLPSPKSITILQELTPGMKYSIRQTIKQKMELPLDTETVELNSHLLAEFELKILSRLPIMADGIAQKRMTIRYLRIALSTRLGPTYIKIDTAQPESLKHTEYEALTMLTQHEFTLVLDQHDNFIRVDGLDDIARKVAFKPQQAALMQQMLTPQHIRQTIRQLQLSTVPKKPIRRGDTWPATMSIPINQVGTVDYSGLYLLVGYKTHEAGEMAKILTQGQVTFHPDNNSQYASAKLHESQFEGIFHYDPQLRLPRYSSIRVTLQAFPQHSDNQATKPIHIDQQTTIEVISTQDL